MGLNGDSSVPEGGCNFTFMDCKQTNKKKWSISYLWRQWKMYAETVETTADIQGEENQSVCEKEEARAGPLAEQNRTRQTNTSE